jgi:hypothetical protein
MKWYQHVLVQYFIWWIPTTLFLCLLFALFGIVGFIMSFASLSLMGASLILWANNRRIKKAIEDLQDYGSDAAHHMQYGIDQTLRDLMGMEAYNAWRAEMALNTYTWDEGIAP